MDQQNFIIPNQDPNPQPAGQSPAPLQPKTGGINKIAVIVLVVILLAGGGFVGYKYWDSSQNQIESLEQNSGQPQQLANNSVSQEELAALQDGSAVLPKIGAAYKTAASFKISGKITTDFLQGYHSRTTNDFSGELVWPKSEHIINNFHEVIEGSTPEGNLDEIFMRENIVVNNKSFVWAEHAERSFSWQADFVVNPLDKLFEEKLKTKLPEKIYKFPDWLVLDYAQSISFEKQENGLFKYKITPKKISYADAIHYLNHQGRLEDGNNTVDSTISGISGSVWINKDFIVIKEEYFIPRYEDEQYRQTYNIPKDSGTLITVNYSNYNEKIEINEPIATPELDKLTADIAAGKTLEQIEKEAYPELSSNPTAGRDAKRVVDVFQLRTAIEHYFTENQNTYPADLASVAPKYIKILPAAPQPADGNCTEQQNAYTYTLVSPQSYKLSFCLGAETGKYGPGVHSATEQGTQ